MKVEVSGCHIFCRFTAKKSPALSRDVASLIGKPNCEAKQQEKPAENIFSTCEKIEQNFNCLQRAVCPLVG
jgi:hypothetical protein